MSNLDVEAVLRARERASQRVRNRVAMEERYQEHLRLGPDRCDCNMCHRSRANSPNPYRPTLAAGAHTDRSDTEQHNDTLAATEGDRQ